MTNPNDDYDLVDELRGWENNLHVPGTQPTHCKTCHTRMPCEWAMAVDEMKQAADRIEELEAALRKAKHHDLCRCGACQFIDRALGDNDE